MSGTDVFARLNAFFSLSGADGVRALDEVSGNADQLRAQLDDLLTVASASFVSVSDVRGADTTPKEATCPTTSAFSRDQILGRYRLIEEIGCGGMAVVWRAEDNELGRTIALKLPLPGKGPELEQRFHIERRALVALKHPNIAHLFDAGVTTLGQRYLALEFVEGTPITDYCNQRQLTIEQRLQLYLQVLNAVEHAHRLSIVHRDLKPSNVFVDVEGQVKLLDFGIAKLLDDDSDVTRGLVATPAYAAPEQLIGGTISIATDIYALGVLLGELLTGDRPPNPLRGSRLVSLPSEPRCGRLRGDLNSIVKKALEDESRDRYASVERFKHDIESFLAHRPIDAKRRAWMDVGRKFVRRNRAATIAVTAGAIATIVFAGVALRQSQQSQANAQRALAVRNFTFDLVNDVEPDEAHPEIEVPGKQMLDRAVARARLEFDSQPLLQGELLGELGRMYTRLGEPKTAAAVMAEALPLLEAHATEDDPALNKTRAHLADAAFFVGEVERARELANQARSACTQAGIECPKARAYASTVLSKIAMREGRVEDALSSLQLSIQETARGFGQQHAETALAYMNYAILARNAGRLREGSAAMRRALEIAEHETLRAADRTMLYRTTAMLDMDLGRYAVARDRLLALVRQTRGREERGLQRRLLANASLMLGNGAAALEAADAAIDDSTAANDAIEVLKEKLVRARALALLGDFDQALVEVDGVLVRLREAGESPNAPAMLRARRARGEILARSGNLQEARSELQGVAAQGFEQGYAKDLLGCVLQQLDQPRQALTLHQSARADLEKELPNDHPFLLRNTLYQTAALAKLDPQPAMRTRLAERAARVKQQFGPDSVWPQLIDECVTRATCRLVL